MRHRRLHRNLILVVGLFSWVLFFDVGSSLACDIKITVPNNAKAVYSVDDEVVFKVSIFLPHRNCPVKIDQTKYKIDGLKVLGASQWKNVSNGLYERFIKVKLLPTDKGESSLHVQRVCEKEGGYGYITLKVG